MSPLLLSFGAMNLIAAAVVLLFRTGGTKNAVSPAAAVSNSRGASPAHDRNGLHGRSGISGSGSVKAASAGSGKPARIFSEDEETARLERELLDSFARFRGPANAAASRKEPSRSTRSTAKASHEPPVAHPSHSRSGMTFEGGAR